jgi:hypothetical protein
MKRSDSDLDKALTLGLIAGQVALLSQPVAVNTFIIVRIMGPFWFLTALVVGIPLSEQPDERQP